MRDQERKREKKVNKMAMEDILSQIYMLMPPTALVKHILLSEIPDPL